MKVLNLGYSKVICTENIFKEIDKLLKEQTYLFKEKNKLLTYNCEDKLWKRNLQKKSS